MLSILAFDGARVKRADAQTIVIQDKRSGAAAVIIRQQDVLIEVLLPDHPDFDRTLKLLNTVAGVAAVKAPSKVDVV